MDGGDKIVDHFAHRLVAIAGDRTSDVISLRRQVDRRSHASIVDAVMP